MQAFTWFLLTSALVLSSCSEDDSGRNVAGDGELQGPQAVDGTLPPGGMAGGGTSPRQTPSGGSDGGVGGTANGLPGGGVTGISGQANGGGAGSKGGATGSSGAPSAGTPDMGGTASEDPGGPVTGSCSVSLDGGAIPVCCAPDPTQRQLIDDVFRLLNAHRAANGIEALSYDLELESAMQGHCRHMAAADFFDHGSPVGELASPWDRAKQCGTTANGENIALGQRTAEEVMADWKKSPGHNRNMLNANYKRVGIGEYDSYWGQLFAE